MAITNFIQSVWSEKLLTELGARYVGAANCNREFEGDIKNVGDRVKICGVGGVSVFDYTKNTDMSSPEALSDTCETLVIDRAKAFNFQIDDVDLAQSSPKLMAAAMVNAASALASEADSYIFSLYTEAGSKIEGEATAGNIIDLIIDARTKLAEANADGSCEVVAEVSPKVASLILKSKIALATDNSDALSAGYVGTVAGCKIFVSNNVKVSEGGIHNCMVRTKRAIAYAEQLSKVHAYRPELRFADALKGLHLYGAKVVYPAELVNLSLSVSEA